MVALVASIPLLIPFADFGLGISVVNAAADAKALGNVSLLTETLNKVRRLLAVIAACIVLLSVVLGSTGAWDALLGAKQAQVFSDLSLAASLVLAIFGTTLLFSQGTRVLQGVGRVGTATLVNGSVQFLSLIGAICVHVLGQSALLYALLIPLSSLVANVIGWCLALGVLRRMAQTPGEAVASAPVRYRVLLGWGLSGMIIAAAVAMTTQGGRVVLGHASSALAVAQFSLVWTVFGGVNSLIAVYGQFLWPRFRTLKVRGVLQRSDLDREMLRAGVLGTILAVLFLLGAPTAISLMSGSSVPWPVIIAGALLLLLLTLHQPATMLLMDLSGSRTQALLIVPFAAINLLLVVFFADTLGAAAPFLATAGVVLALQGPATFFIARRSIRSY
ncbi:hypothetical protein [Cryobacterium soli]|uniref:hypothetical protein n=1 Tax=Cryobacterium soli TaxID=2220095 RepID=UPI0013C4F7BE|nr:hypothetical protein [Cryobacterium soli]